MSFASKRHAIAGLLLIAAVGFAGCESQSPAGLEQTVQPGEISVEATPADLNAPWFLIQPNKQVMNGEGAQVIEDLPPGNYQLVWGAVGGWQSPTPNPVSSLLNSGGSIEFSATYTEIVIATGSIAVDTTPDSINAPWTLSGPNGFVTQGNGDQILDGREPGVYTLTFEAVPDYQTASTVQGTLEAGSRLDFAGEYIFQAPPAVGTIIIDANPDAIDAPWTLRGPDSLNLEGRGDASIPEMVVGTYTVSFGAVSGWDFPVPSVITIELTADAVITATGNYTETGPPGANDPVIDSISGGGGNGATVTIAGSQFGSHTLDLESSLGPQGWIESAGTGANVASASAWSNYGTKVPAFIDGSRAHSGSKAINASIDRSADDDWQKTFYFEKPAKFTKIYASYWVYWNPTKYGDNTQWKMWRVGDDTGMVVTDNCASLYQTSYWSPSFVNTYQTTYHCMDGCAWPAQIQCYENIVPEPFYTPDDGLPYNFRLHNRGGRESFASNAPVKGGWTRIEFYLQASDLDTPNGKYWLSTNRPGEPRKMVDNWITGLVTHRSSCCADETNEWDHFVLQGMFDDNGGGFGDEEADLFYDDIYLQFGTSARVELGNSPNFNSCTQLEVQEVVSWNAGQIQIRLNHGGFDPGQQLYLFVVSDDGSASAGQPITIQ